MKYLVVVFFLISLTVDAQKLKVDKITGDSIWITDLDKLYSKASFSGTVGEQLKVVSSKSKNGTIVSFWIQTGKTSIFRIQPGSIVFIKLEDKTLLKMETLSSELSNYAPSAYGSNNIAHILISDTNKQLLLNSPVSVIRIETSRGNFDYEIKDKFSNVIADQISSINK